MWQNEVVNYSDCSSGLGDISEDPLFISENDYHLKSNSLCIDAGDPSLEFNDSDGSKNDMGVYGGPYQIQEFIIDEPPAEPPIDLTPPYKPKSVKLAWMKEFAYPVYQTTAVDIVTD